MGVIDLTRRALEKRQRCSGYSGYGYRYCDSAWDRYGRWILTAAIIVGFFLLFLIFSCITARRRRRRGVQPFYGTAWAAHGQPQYTNNQPQYGNQTWDGQQYQTYNQGWNSQPPPMYGAQANDGTAWGMQQPKPADYTGQQQGVELQQPGQAYQRGSDNIYQPPAGPPPAK